MMPTASCSDIHTSPGDNHQNTGGRSERTQARLKGSRETHSVTYVCTRTLHSFQSFQSFVHCRTSSTVIPLLLKATFTPSIQPNLGLPRTRPQLTEVGYEVDLSSHLLPSGRTELIHSFHMPTTSHSLISLYTFVTLQPNFSNTTSQEHSLSLSQHFSYPVSLRRTTPLVQLHLHKYTSWPLSSILYF